MRAAARTAKTLATSSATDPVRFAASLKLRYVTDDSEGWTRRRCGRGWQFLQADGSPIRAAEKGRLKAIAIPPAWESVWICPDPAGHLQATGRDGRRRKQYRYHPIWTRSANLLKFAGLEEFGQTLPSIRRRVRRDLKLDSFDRRRVLATVVRLLDRGFLRVGNEAYTRENQTFGATTLRSRHVEVGDDEVCISFFGKHHIEREVRLSDPILAGVLEELSASPRRRLFCYRDTFGWHDISSAQVNEYLAAITPAATAKTFRTWHASELMTDILRRRALAAEKPRKRDVSEGIRTVAGRLGNRPATCRKFYVHPGLVQTYLDGRLPAIEPIKKRGLRQPEQLLLGYLASASPVLDRH